MNRNKKTSFLIPLFSWIFAYAFLGILTNSHYLFQWLEHNKFFYIGLGLIAILLTLVKKKLGYSMALGNVCGLFLGEFLGEYLRKQSMLRITKDMSAKTKCELSSSRGFLIWVGCIIGSIFVFVIIEFLVFVIIKFKNKRKTFNSNN